MQQSWTPTILAATLAVAFAAVGLVSTTFYPGATPLLTTGLLLASLAATTWSFALVALRVRRLELENEGLIEEISQKFDRVEDKIDIFGEALSEPRTLAPSEVEPEVPMRRVAIK